MRKLLIGLVGLISLFTSLSAFGTVTISNTALVSTTSSTAQITWTTSGISTSQVLYGTNGQLNLRSPLDSTPVTSHTMTLTNLIAGVVYSYSVHSKDNSDNTVAVGTTFTFAVCPVFTNGLTKVTGGTNVAYEYGNYTFTLVNDSGSAIAPTVCGVPVTTPSSSTMDLHGNITINLTDNNYIVPSPSHWSLSVTSLTGTGGAIGSFTVAPLTISGSSQDISTQLQTGASGQLQHVFYDPATASFNPPVTGAGGGTVTSVGASTTFPGLTVGGSPIIGAGTLTFSPTAGQTANLFMATPNGSTGALSLRAIAGGDLPAINLAAGGAGGVSGILPILNGGSGTSTPALVAGTNITLSGSWPNQTINSTASGSGTVTSVAQTTTFPGLTVGGSPVTTSGTLTLTPTAGQTANSFLATPNGTTGALSLRTIVGGDLPAINVATSGAGGITGLVPVANGGSGTATPALVAGTNVTITGSWPNQTINSSGAGSGTFAGLTPGTNTSTTPFSVAPSTTVGGTTANFSFLGPASDTNTGQVVNIDTGSASTQPAFRVGIQGQDAIKVQEITGNNQQIILGSCSATQATSGDLGRLTHCSQSATVTTDRSLNSSATFTGTILQAESIKAAGIDFKLFSGRTGCSTDGTCSSGAETFNVLGSGLVNATGVQINGATSGSATLSATATGSTLNLGSTNATVSSAGLGTFVGLTGTGAVDFSGASSTKARVTAGLTTTSNGSLGYDSTNKNWHFFQNGVDSFSFGGPVSSTYTNGDCVQFGVAANVITLVDTGSACGSGGGSTVFPITVSGTVTSGGIPFFSSTTVESSSGLLAAGHILLGGGAGSAPTSDANLDDGITTANTLTYAGTGGIAVSSAVAGVFALGQGTAAGTSTNSVGLAGATTIPTAYNDVLPSGASTGYLKFSTATNQTGCTASSTNMCGLYQATIPVADGGTGTTTPALVAGTNITITGSWPNQTINSSAGGGSVTSVAETTTFPGLTVGGSPVTTSGTLTLSPTAGQTANNFLATPNGTTGALALRTIVGGDLPAINLATSGAGGVTGLLGVSNGGSGTATPAIVAGTNVTVSGSWPNQTINSTGTVTSVAQTTTFPGLTVGGSPITGSGTITLTPTSAQTANSFLATPDGTTGALALRTVVAGDLPAINVAAGGAGGITGIVPVANGGSGTATPAIVAGTNVTITGSWPNQTINASGGSSGTVNSGTANHFGFYSSTGTAISDAGTNLQETTTGVSVTGQSTTGSAFSVVNAATGQSPATFNAITGTTVDITDWQVNAVTKAFVDSGGGLHSATLQSTGAAGNMTVQCGTNTGTVGGCALIVEGGDHTAATGTDQAGTTVVRGGNNNSNVSSASVTAGDTTFKPGVLSNAAPGAAALEGQLHINTAWKSAGTLNTLACQTTTASTAQTCSSTANNLLWIGIFQETIGGSQLVQGIGDVLVTLDASVTATPGDILCVSTTVAGQIFDSGSTACPNNQSYVGKVKLQTTSPSTSAIALIDRHPIGGFVVSGTSAMGTSAIASGACATAVTTTATGVATTDVLTAGFNGDPTGVTGYAPSASGMLTIISYPTSGNVNFKVCNNTGASITPGAITLNWRVAR